MSSSQLSSGSATTLPEIARRTVSSSQLDSPGRARSRAFVLAIRHGHVLEHVLDHLLELEARVRFRNVLLARPRSRKLRPERRARSRSRPRRRSSAWRSRSSSSGLHPDDEVDRRVEDLLDERLVGVIPISRQRFR